MYDLCFEITTNDCHIITNLPGNISRIPAEADVSYRACASAAVAIDTLSKKAEIFSYQTG